MSDGLSGEALKVVLANAERRGAERALDAVVIRADEGIEFGPQNYLLLLRIVRDVRLSLRDDAPTEEPPC